MGASGRWLKALLGVKKPSKSAAEKEDNVGILFLFFRLSFFILLHSIALRVYRHIPNPIL
jgi:hypothetical protein